MPSDLLWLTEGFAHVDGMEEDARQRKQSKSDLSDGISVVRAEQQAVWSDWVWVTGRSETGGEGAKQLGPEAKVSGIQWSVVKSGDF